MLIHQAQEKYNYDFVPNILTKEFIKRHDINEEYAVAKIDGKDFDASLFNYGEFTSDCK